MADNHDSDTLSLGTQTAGRANGTERVDAPSQRENASQTSEDHSAKSASPVPESLVVQPAKIHSKDSETSVDSKKDKEDMQPSHADQPVRQAEDGNNANHYDNEHGLTEATVPHIEKTMEQQLDPAGSNFLQTADEKLPAEEPEIANGLTDVVEPQGERENIGINLNDSKSPADRYEADASSSNAAVAAQTESNANATDTEIPVKNEESLVPPGDVLLDKHSLNPDATQGANVDHVLDTNDDSSTGADEIIPANIENIPIEGSPDEPEVTPPKMTPVKTSEPILSTENVDPGTEDKTEDDSHLEVPSQVPGLQHSGDISTLPGKDENQGADTEVRMVHPIHATADATAVEGSLEAHPQGEDAEPNVLTQDVPKESTDDIVHDQKKFGGREPVQAQGHLPSPAVAAVSEPSKVEPKNFEVDQSNVTADVEASPEHPAKTSEESEREDSGEVENPTPERDLPEAQFDLSRKESVEHSDPEQNAPSKTNATAASTHDADFVDEAGIGKTQENPLSGEETTSSGDYQAGPFSTPVDDQIPANVAPMSADRAEDQPVGPDTSVPSPRVAGEPALSPGHIGHTENVEHRRGHGSDVDMSVINHKAANSEQLGEPPKEPGTGDDSGAENAKALPVLQVSLDQDEAVASDEPVAGQTSMSSTVLENSVAESKSLTLIPEPQEPGTVVEPKETTIASSSDPIIEHPTEDGHAEGSEGKESQTNWDMIEPSSASETPSQTGAPMSHQLDDQHPIDEIPAIPHNSDAEMAEGRADEADPRVTEPSSTPKGTGVQKDSMTIDNGVSPLDEDTRVEETQPNLGAFVSGSEDHIATPKNDLAPEDKSLSHQGDEQSSERLASEEKRLQTDFLPISPENIVSDASAHASAGATEAKFVPDAEFLDDATVIKDVSTQRIQESVDDIHGNNISNPTSSAVSSLDSVTEEDGQKASEITNMDRESLHTSEGQFGFHFAGTSGDHDSKMHERSTVTGDGDVGTEAPNISTTIGENEEFVPESLSPVADAGPSLEGGVIPLMDDTTVHPTLDVPNESQDEETSIHRELGSDLKTVPTATTVDPMTSKENAVTQSPKGTNDEIQDVPSSEDSESTTSGTLKDFQTEAAPDTTAGLVGSEPESGLSKGEEKHSLLERVHDRAFSGDSIEGLPRSSPDGTIPYPDQGVYTGGSKPREANAALSESELVPVAISSEPDVVIVPRHEEDSPYGQKHSDAVGSFPESASLSENPREASQPEALVQSSAKEVEFRGGIDEMRASSPVLLDLHPERGRTEPDFEEASTSAGLFGERNELHGAPKAELHLSDATDENVEFILQADGSQQLTPISLAEGLRSPQLDHESADATNPIRPEAVSSAQDEVFFREDSLTGGTIIVTEKESKADSPVDGIHAETEIEASNPVIAEISRPTNVSEAPIDTPEEGSRTSVRTEEFNEAVSPAPDVQITASSAIETASVEISLNEPVADSQAPDLTPHVAQDLLQGETLDLSDAEFQRVRSADGEITRQPLLQEKPEPSVPDSLQDADNHSLHEQHVKGPLITRIHVDPRHAVSPLESKSESEVLQETTPLAEEINPFADAQSETTRSDIPEVATTPRSELGVFTPTFDSRSEVSAASNEPNPPLSPRADPSSPVTGEFDSDVPVLSTSDSLAPSTDPEILSRDDGTKAASQANVESIPPSSSGQITPQPTATRQGSGSSEVLSVDDTSIPIDSEIQRDQTSTEIAATPTDLHKDHTSEMQPAADKTSEIAVQERHTQTPEDLSQKTLESGFPKDVVDEVVIQGAGSETHSHSAAIAPSKNEVPHLSADIVDIIDNTHLHRTAGPSPVVTLPSANFPSTPDGETTFKERIRVEPILIPVPEDDDERNTRSDYLDTPQMKPRTRLASTASSRLLPGGWVSDSPRPGRASLDTATGEFSPPIRPTNIGEETVKGHPKKKSRLSCVIM